MPSRTLAAAAQSSACVTYEEFGAVGDGRADSSGGPCLFAMFNAENTGPGHVERCPCRVPEEVVLRHVTGASGKALRLSPNPCMFRNVKLLRT